jgi:hypothetical protein
MGNPGIWWGILGLAVPILLHFWHQKRGKELDWAATRWLREVALQRSRGFRLEDILLLFLRCAVLLSLLLYLSRPFWRLPGESEKRVHWVQADSKVVEAYRFELEEAKKKGEDVLWFGGEAADDLKVLPQNSEVQSGLNTWTSKAKHELYLRNDLGFSALRPVYVPGPFAVHIYSDSSKVSASALPSALQVLGSNKTVLAALRSIEEVRGISIAIDTVPLTGKKYDIRFLTSADDSPDLQVIIGSWQSSREKEVVRKNVVYLPEELKSETSDLVFNGKLPEWILHLIQLQPDARLTVSQVNELFKEKKNTAIPFEAQYLWIFILLLAAERWWSIRKNA